MIPENPGPLPPEQVLSNAIKDGQIEQAGRKLLESKTPGAALLLLMGALSYFKPDELMLVMGQLHTMITYLENN